MRISISGSFSTGKTTLARAAVERASAEFGASRICLIEETARKVIAAGFQLDRNGTIEAYSTYIQMQLEAERRADAEVVVSDRSLADLLAYLWTNAEADKHIPASFVAMLEEIVRIESRYFDLYCYIPIEFALVVDDVRPADERYQRTVDETFRRVLQTLRLPHQEVRGTAAERVQQVVNLLGLKGS